MVGIVRFDRRSRAGRDGGSCLAAHLAVRFLVSRPFRVRGGLEPGATFVRGGPKVGRVEKLRFDPKDSSRIEIKPSA